MKVTCERDGAGPYYTVDSWLNHLSIHREADLEEVARGGTARLERLQHGINIMNEQEKKVLKELLRK
jgi:hypothetical protein